MGNLLYEDESYKIIGACYNVHNEMGAGFLEAVYQECLAIDFARFGIPFVAQPELKLCFQGHELRQRFQPDFACYEKIILEIKAVSALISDHRAQLLNYLNGAKMQLGLLVNFGARPKLEYERMVLSQRS